MNTLLISNVITKRQGGWESLTVMAETNSGNRGGKSLILISTEAEELTRESRVGEMNYFIMG